MTTDQLIKSKAYVQKAIITNYLQKPLPEHIQTFVKDRIISDSKNLEYAYKRIMHRDSFKVLKLNTSDTCYLSLVSVFSWKDQPEGETLWNEVYQGHYTRFNHLERWKHTHEKWKTSDSKSIDLDISKLRTWIMSGNIVNHDNVSLPSVIQDFIKNEIMTLDENVKYAKDHFITQHRQACLPLIKLFQWHNHIRGGGFWTKINRGDYQEFYRVYDSGKFGIGSQNCKEHSSNLESKEDTYWIPKFTNSAGKEVSEEITRLILEEWRNNPELHKVPIIQAERPRSLSISGALVWRHTSQGHSFWNDVFGSSLPEYLLEAKTKAKELEKNTSLKQAITRRKTVLPYFHIEAEPAPINPGSRRTITLNY